MDEMISNYVLFAEFQDFFRKFLTHIYRQKVIFPAAIRAVNVINAAAIKIPP